jgi:hypothetical protein
MVVLGIGLAGSLAAVTAAAAQSPVSMEFPSPGTRWITGVGH